MARPSPAARVRRLARGLRILPLAAGLAATAAAQDVTLALDRYDELVARAYPEAEKEPPPAVPLAFEAAMLDLEVDETRARIESDLTVTLIASDWQSVPLPGRGSFVAVDFGGLEGRLDPTGHVLWLRGEGRHRLHLSSVLPIAREESATRATWRLRFETPAAALVRGFVSAAGIAEIEVESGSAFLDEPDPQGRRRLVAEPGSEVVLVFRAEANAPALSELPVRSDAVSAAALEVRRERRLLHAWITALVRQGRLEELTVGLPEDYDVVRLDGAVAGWEIRDRNLVVTPRAAVDDRLDVALELVAPPAAELDSPLLKVSGASSTFLVFKTEIRGDGFLDLVDPGDARQLDSEPREPLPSGFRAAAGRALVLDGERPPRWQTSWADATEVLAAQIDRLLLDVVIGSSGRAAYQLWAEVRSSGAGHLTLSLPGDLVAARRGSAVVVPGRSAAGWIVPLSAAAESELVYLAGILPLELPRQAGILTVPLPRTSAPAARVEVRVRLPEDGRSFRLVDAARAGRVGPPPSAAPAGEVPLVVSQLRLLATSADVPGTAAWPALSGFAVLEASWSALSAEPAPLEIRIETQRPGREWF